MLSRIAVVIVLVQKGPMSQHEEILILRFGSIEVCQKNNGRLGSQRRIAIAALQEQTWRRYEKGINRFVDIADRLGNTRLSSK
jgi:hypothetical protein